MKQIKILSFSLIMAVLMISLSSSIPVSKEETVLEKKVSNDNISMLSTMTNKQFLTLSPQTYYKLTGIKMSFKERMALRIAQKNIRSEIKSKSIEENATINYEMAVGNGESSFRIGGFILGFLLGLIGVGLAYIFSNDKDFIRSTWKGLGGWVILLLVLALL
ncbi:MAG: hypothetical protein NTY72_15525 [Bacteroidetes bacterium]|nr:hypothetical protein [Bacteroidota bacterium]